MIKLYTAYGTTVVSQTSGRWRSYVTYTVDETDSAVIINVTDYGIQSQYSAPSTFNAGALNGTLLYDSRTVESYANSKSISISGIGTTYSLKNSSSALSRTIQKDLENKSFEIQFSARATFQAITTSTAKTRVPIPAINDPAIGANIFRSSGPAGFTGVAFARVAVTNIPVGTLIKHTISVDYPYEVSSKHPNLELVYEPYETVTTKNEDVVHIPLKLAENGTEYGFTPYLPFDFHITTEITINDETTAYPVNDTLDVESGYESKRVDIVVYTDDVPPYRKTDGTSNAEVLAYDYINNWWETIVTSAKVNYITEYSSVVGYSIEGVKIEPRFFEDPILTNTKVKVQVEYVTSESLENEDHQAFFKTTRNCGFTNGMANVMFVGGSELPNYGSRVWYSYYNDPLYFPDDYFIEVGTNDTNIMGLTKIGEYLGIIKQGKTTDTAIYIAYPTSFDNNSTYAVKPSASGIGAVSKYAFNILGNETLFLSKEGVMAISFNEEDIDKQVKNRSYFVDGKLLSEPVDKLQNAYSFVWKGYYILAVENEEDNGHVYVLDGNQRNSWGNDRTNLVYECYYWNNVPAKCFARFNNDLWFSDGTRMCRFKTTQDEKPYNDNGDAIRAEWATIFDDDGASQYQKNLVKKGSKLTLMPFDKGTSCDVYFRTDKDVETLIGSANSDDANVPIDFYFKKKLKKYKRLQIIVRNEVPDQPFGISQIVKLYTLGSYSK